MSPIGAAGAESVRVAWPGTHLFTDFGETDLEMVILGKLTPLLCEHRAFIKDLHIPCCHFQKDNLFLPPRYLKYALTSNPTHLCAFHSNGVETVRNSPVQSRGDKNGSGQHQSRGRVRPQEDSRGVGMLLSMFFLQGGAQCRKFM